MKLQSTLTIRPDFLYLAPLLNVLLLLLIYFLLNSTLLVRSGIRVDLPVSGSILEQAAHSHVITVTAGSSPRIFLNEKEVYAGDLVRVLTDARKETRKVLLNADAMAPNGVVQRVENAVIQAGCDLSIGTRMGEE